MRCNVDVQDMRRVLPPQLWMRKSDLDPIHEGVESMHGAYPQRCKDFSMGEQVNWGWFQHLGTTVHSAHEIVMEKDWPSIFTSLSAATLS